MPDNVWTSHSRSELNNDQLTWKITSHIPEQQNEPLTIKDTLPEGLIYKNATIKANDQTLTLQPKQEGNTIAWTIEPEHAGKTITITLTAKLDPNNIEWHTSDDQPKMRCVHFGNNATIYQNDTPIKTVTQTQSVLESTVKNPITKTDPTKPTKKSTTHEYKELANEQLTWKLTLEIEPDQTNALQIKDTFPQGLRFEKAQDNTGKEIQPTIQGQTLQIDLDKEFIKQHKGQTIKYLLYFSILDNYEWTIDPNDPKIGTAIFNNTCQVLENGTVSDQDEQTQTITQNLFENALKKEGTYDESDGNMTYTVKINPEGKDYHSTSGTLHITDQLKYRYKGDDYDSFRIYFRPAQTKLYTWKNGTKEEIPQDQWKLKYTIATDPWDTGMQQINIDLDVPDGQALELQYKYQVWSHKTATQSVNNNIELLIDNKLCAESRTSVTVKANLQSGASAGTRSIKFYKVDEENVNIHLPGAQFEVYQYQDGEYKKLEQILETQQDGTVEFSNFDFNTAYYLKEIKAPQNYKLDPTPYYFYIVGTETAQNSNMPEGFETDPNTHAYTRAMKTIL